ncbi:polysaccharide pyruvyl transferase CsaB [Paenibacillus anaericanus]|uniref:Polysaccharide pyruvyl transferase CsaB n=1 Tax=Paenibacillus anaericanus TaxID=170367 RepID=A0A433Y418_9BACL|nr:polysaccharide pyruvyl transferase CsaB [Paenibacillus anaericanus]RUT42962.1 polysaccharide pyruvyl transferase CsaB [Paenibacillus anaericanus]
MVTASTKTIVISGYYGFRNSGDEAVLKSILTALEEEGRAIGMQINPVVLSIDPEWTTRTYGVRAVHRMKLGEVRNAIKNSSGLISGGGSLLQDVTGSKSIPYYLGVIKLAQWMRKPTFVYAQGIGPVNRKLFHGVIASVFRRCKYISVRDVESAELLRSMGIQDDSIQVVPDPVMGLSLPEGQDDPKSGPTTRGLPIIGVSVRYWNPKRTELNELAEGLRLLSLRVPVHIRFLPFHFPGDDEASRYLMNRIGNVQDNGSRISIAKEVEHPQDMLREVSRSSLLIGMRLHSLIYAASQNVPMLGVSYDPKIDHFLGRIGLLPIGTSEDLDPHALVEEGERLLLEGEAWRLNHATQIADLKAESRIPARRIVEYLRSKG